MVNIVHVSRIDKTTNITPSEMPSIQFLNNFHSKKTTFKIIEEGPEASDLPDYIPDKVSFLPHSVTSWYHICKT